MGFELDEQLTKRLKDLSQQCGVTMYMMLLAGFAAVLSRLSGQEEVIIGTPTANRGRVEIEGLIGFFVNTLALRIDFSGEPTLREALSRIRAVVLGAQEHQDLPFEQVVDVVKPTCSLAHTPLFQVMFDWQNDEDRSLRLLGVQVTEIRVPDLVAKFDLTLTLAETGGRIVGGLSYATALFDAVTVQRYAGYLHQVLLRMTTGHRQSIEAIDVLPALERHRLAGGVERHCG